MVAVEELQEISNALAQLPLVKELDNSREAEAIDEAINRIVSLVDNFIDAMRKEAVG